MHSAFRLTSASPLPHLCLNFCSCLNRYFALRDKSALTLVLIRTVRTVRSIRKLTASLVCVLTRIDRVHKCNASFATALMA